MIEHFIAGTAARATSELIGIQPNTVIRFYLRRRKLIARKLPSYELSGGVEADQSYFGGVRKDKRGRGAAEKAAVFCFLKRGGKVFTTITSDAKTDTLLPIIEEKVQPDSIASTDTFRSYNALDTSALHHRRINHGKLSAARQNHMNGIENFYWFLKNCEWSFNGGNHKTLLAQLKFWYKSAKH